MSSGELVAHLYTINGFSVKSVDLVENYGGLYSLRSSLLAIFGVKTYLLHIVLVDDGLITLYLGTKTYGPAAWDRAERAAHASIDDLRKERAHFDVADGWEYRV